MWKLGAFVLSFFLSAAVFEVGGSSDARAVTAQGLGDGPVLSNPATTTFYIEAAGLHGQVLGGHELSLELDTGRVLLAGLESLPEVLINRTATGESRNATIFAASGSDDVRGAFVVMGDRVSGALS